MNVYIAALSDMEPDAERRLRWGDYWFKDSLGKALEAQGQTIVGDVLDADVLINLHGGRIQQLPEWTWNVLWIIGHPDAVTEQECDEYDAVYSESEMFAEHIAGAWGIPCVHLPGASDFEPLGLLVEHNGVFVGNWRPGRALDWSAKDGSLEIWGEGWQGHLPEGATWMGTEYPHEHLNRLYGLSSRPINQTYPDMERWGFHNPRHYDIAAVRGEQVPTFADCAAAIMAGVPEHRMMLDLGGAPRPRRGMVGVDLQGGPDIVVHNLEDGLPIHGADVIVADNVLEHIEHLIPLMNDCHEALLPGGRMHVVVPNAQNPDDAWADPTHKRAFVPGTFAYFDGRQPRWQQYGYGYGILPWRIVSLAQDGRFIRVTMRPEGAVA